MFFNLVLILFWLLAFVAPVRDYARYIKSLSDTRYIAPDKPIPSVMVSAIIPLVFPAPSPGPRYTVLAVPVYTSTSDPKESQSVRFDRRKHMITIYKFVGELIDRLANLVGRPRPTKTGDHPTPDPTKVPPTAYPALPVPASHSLEHASTYVRSNPGIDPAALWSTYKLLVGWGIFTFFVTIFAFVRFLARDNLDKHASAPNGLDVAASSPPTTESFLIALDSIIDLCAALPPSDTCENTITPSNLVVLSPEDIPLPEATDDELMALDTSITLPGSASVHVPHALFADIDTKSRVEGKTDTHGTSTEGKTLEPAVSNDSIGSIVGFYARESSAASPSGSASHPSSPTTQVYTPRRKRWLQNLVIHLQAMERQGNYLGRVYENWDDDSELEIQDQGSPAEPAVTHGGDSASLDGHVPSTTDDIAYPESSGFDSNDRDLSSGNTSVNHFPALVSRDSIDAQMEIMLGEQEQMIFDQKLGARYDPVPVPGLVPRANLKPGVEGDSALEARVIKGVSGLPVRGSLRVVERSTKSPRATDIPLPPSPPPAGATLEHTLEEPVHHVHPDSSTVDIDSTPVTLPPSPFLEESC